MNPKKREVGDEKPAGRAAAMRGQMNFTHDPLAKCEPKSHSDDRAKSLSQYIRTTAGSRRRKELDEFNRRRKRQASGEHHQESKKVSGPSPGAVLAQHAQEGEPEWDTEQNIRDAVGSRFDQKPVGHGPAKGIDCFREVTGSELERHKASHDSERH